MWGDPWRLCERPTQPLRVPASCATSTSFGATNVLTNLKKYVPEGGEGKLRVAVNGDQAFVARCRQSVDCKSDEDSVQNLNCFLPLAQDFHAQMVSICSMKKIDYE